MTNPVEHVIESRSHDLGAGFSVRRILPHHSRRMVGPFIFFDHFGPATYAPANGFDVRPHPHIGLATVTYLFEGAIAHKDTVGSDIVIRPGAVNWMTAGRGIVHSERTPPAERASGQDLHGIQTWVALPTAHEEDAPAFSHHGADSLPVFELGGAQARLIAGQAWGQRSPVGFSHPIWYLAIEAGAGTASFEIPAGEAEERAVYVAEGSAIIDTQHLRSGMMAILAPGSDVSVRLEADTRLMLAGGARMDGPRHIEWNLVSSRPERIERAKADWRASIANGWKDTVFRLPEGEAEWIELPQEP